MTTSLVPRRALAALVATSLAAPGLAAAGDAEGYRAQVIAVDVSADAMLLSCFIEATRCKLGESGAILYVFGGPAAHIVHERWKEAGASLGLRVAAPLLAGLLGMAATASDGGSDDDDDDDDDDGFALSGLPGLAGGMIVGALGAQILDAALLAGPREDDTGLPRARMITLGGSF